MKRTTSHPAESESRLVREARAFNVKKRLGQHFLISDESLQQIVAVLEPTPQDIIIEVGPGIGFLTRLLAECGARIVAVDLDRESTEKLTSMALPNVEVLQGDFLQFEISTLKFFKSDETPGEARSDIGDNERLKVVGNVPYQITGLIIGHILGEIDKPAPWLRHIDNIVLTVQHEVAKRLVASAGDADYSRVSLLTDYLCHRELISVLPPDCFYPPPRVTSAVIRLKPRKQIAVTCRDPRLLRQLIHAGFRQRRKMFRNSLSFLRLPGDQIDRLFKQLCFDPQVRAERLSLVQFAMLADAIHMITTTHAHSDNSTGTSQD